MVVGGSGKTPVVAALAGMLLEAGERPAILSRGYGRLSRTSDLVLVSDGTRVLEPPERSGDEPQLLARRLRGVPVLVAAERYRAGRVAETRFGSTVMLLDDGFQHLSLARDVDLLIVSPQDLRERVLPAGSLREPLSAARAADAVLVPGTHDDARQIQRTLGVGHAFTLSTAYERLRLVTSGEEVGDSVMHARVIAVAGIARPARFFDALRAAGHDVAMELPFRDHHWFTARDFERVDAAVREFRAALVVTTEKDAMRLGARTSSVPWAVLPMRMSIEPADVFRSWLLERIAAARLERNKGVPAADGAAQQ